MYKRNAVKSHGFLIGAALAAGVGGATTAGAAAGNPFDMTRLTAGYQLAHQDSDKGHARQEQSQAGSAQGKPKNENQGKPPKKSTSEGNCGAAHMKANEGKCGGHN